jgi:hypothetical protein
VHFNPEDALGRRADLAEVDGAADLQPFALRPVLRGHPLIHVDSCGDGILDGVEQHHRAVAFTLARGDPTTVLARDQRHDLRNSGKRVDPRLPLADHEPCGGPDIPEQQGDPAVGLPSRPSTQRRVVLENTLVKFLQLWRRIDAKRLDEEGAHSVVTP